MDWTRLASERFEEVVGRQEYLDYAKGNPYAEVDAPHFRDVSRLAVDLWGRKYDLDCPIALPIAGLYHDFDRVFPPDHSADPRIRTKRRMIDTKSLPDSGYTEDQIKLDLHPQNCAAIFRDYNPGIPLPLQMDISFLIARHERGAEMAGGKFFRRLDEFTGSYNLNRAANVLCEADGLGFFSLIVYSYVKGRSPERAREKIRLSFGKLSPQGQELARAMKYHPVEFEGERIDVDALVREVIG